MRLTVLKDKFCVAIATLFGVGYTPLCPGTASCVVAAGVLLLVKSQVAFLAVTAISLVLAYACSGRAEKVFEEKDSKKIVIDDFSGMLITYLFIPREPAFIVIGFFVFRMFDMLKVPPADRLERCSGAKGVVGDDVVAGLYALGIMQLTRLFL